MRYLIIGGGAAGTTAAEELRRRDSRSEITIISEEHHPLYSRVLLPHYLKGKIPRERVFVKREAWYGEQGIEWLVGMEARRVDTQNKFIELSDGREMPYDKLLIATGGEVRTLPEDRRGVSYLRTLDDADHLLELIQEQGSKARAIIWGGRFIACEYVNIFHHFGIPTILTHRGDHFWTDVLLPEAAALFRGTLEQGGIEVQEGVGFLGLDGDRELEGVVTSHGTFPATILGVGIGIEPDFSFLRGSDINIGRGIKADAFLQTNIKDVYTAGDVAEFFDVSVGRERVIGNWMNAMTQGRVVARTMSGEPTRFELVSSYTTNVLGLEIIFVGDVEKPQAGGVHLIGSSEDGGVTQVFERDGRVVGGVMIGRNQDRARITQAIREKQPFGSLTFSSQPGKKKSSPTCGMVPM